IAECENITLENGAAERIARIAEGGMRDAVSLLELCSGGGAAVTEEHVHEVLGVSGYAAACDTARAVAAKDMRSLFNIVAKISETKDIAVYWQELISFWRDMLVAKYAEDFRSYLDITENEAEMLASVSSSFSLGALVYQSGILDDAMRTMVRSPQTKRVTAELAFVKMCQPAADSSPEALMARISELEDKVKLLSAGAVIAEIPANSGVKTEVKAEPENTAASDGSAASEKIVESKPVPESVSAEKKAVKNEAVAFGEYAPVSDISGVIEKLAKTSPMAVDFFRESRVEISSDGRKVRVIPQNDLSHMMLSDSEVLRAISEAFLLSGVCSAVPDVSIEKAVKTKKASPADDLFGL
ncbi:MAG: hypothetical protein E7578_08670, partial [Ruminococcaceae bacterium]|nr:hypothetical protein [Oscillospiraceae bacterium]